MEKKKKKKFGKREIFVSQEQTKEMPSWFLLIIIELKHKTRMSVPHK